jgi:hypothetical protein
MVMVRAHTLDFVPLAGIAGWSVSAEKGGGHVWWRARLDERGKRLTLSDGGDWSGDPPRHSCRYHSRELRFSQRASMRAG